jgi:hypothetical protein
MNINKEAPAYLTSEDRLLQAVRTLLDEVRSKSALCSLQVKEGQARLQNAGLFDEVDQVLRKQVLDLAADAVAEGCVEISRAIGCLVGMAVADGLGHNFEFLPVPDLGWSFRRQIIHREQTAASYMAH